MKSPDYQNMIPVNSWWCSVREKEPAGQDYQTVFSQLQIKEKQ